MIVVVTALGGAVGALGRFWLMRFNGDAEAGSLPRGTLTANLVGCFGLGVLTSLTDDPLVLAGLATGVLGGLTTFSTFAVEAAIMPRTRGWRYVAISVVAGVVTAAVGGWTGSLVVG